MDDIELVGKPGSAARRSLTDVGAFRRHPATFRGNRDVTGVAQRGYCLLLAATAERAHPEIGPSIRTIGCDREHHHPRSVITLRANRTFDVMTEGSENRN